MEVVEVTVPGGYEDGGRWRRTVRLRPWCGQDEALLVEDLAEAPPAVRTTALLARCTLGDGGAGVDPSFTRALAVGDREALLLHLRRVTLGDRISCVLTCPACGARLDLDLNTADLLVPPYDQEGREHEARIETDVGPLRAVFRLPNGADQEEAARLVEQQDDEGAAGHVLARCLKGVTDGSGQALAGLPVEVAQRLPEIMAERDPQAEIRLDAACPDCGRAFVVPFDCGQYVQEEMARSARNLYREVHTLASYYHWSEGEILALTSRKRRLYLSLIAEGRSHAAVR